MSSAVPAKPVGKAPVTDIPLYKRPPFAKQISRRQAVNGKLLEDNTMVRVLRGATSNDMVYDIKYNAQSHTHDLGSVRKFADVVGRIELSRSGTRSAAQGTFPSNWRPTAPPNDTSTRPSSASSGVAFNKQITRKQDVNGKLLEDSAITRLLFASQATGPEYYEKAHDTIMEPNLVSNRPKVGHGQHRFKAQTGRVPLARSGTRAAANGIFPSHWEPGMGYSAAPPKASCMADFARQPGRVELYLSGMRGAPPKHALAADFMGPSRPQSAMAILRGEADTGGLPKRRPISADTSRPIPERLKKHVEAHSFTKQLTRDQWTSRPLRSG